MEKSCIWNFNYVENKSKLPKSWEEFCEKYPIKREEYYISTASSIVKALQTKGTSERLVGSDSNILPDRSSAEAIIALCKLIQLRNAYNGNWVPNWFDYHQTKYIINLVEKDIVMGDRKTVGEILYFKTEELRNEFLRCFRPLIEKIKPLYGIYEGGEE